MELNQTDTIFRAIWNAATNADNWGFSQQPAARLCSILAILINRQHITRGGSSTGRKKSKIILLK